MTTFEAIAFFGMIAWMIWFYFILIRPIANALDAFGQWLGGYRSKK